MVPGCTATSAAQSIASTTLTNRHTSSRVRHGIVTILQALEAEPVILDARRRTSVERAICETCKLRKWHLHALSVRTNHVHVVVCIRTLKPKRALTALKANATRQMRQDQCWFADSTPWAERGSLRYLWKSKV